MRVFVTGGAGFVGAPILRLLQRRGHDVLALSRQEYKNADIDKGRGQIKWCIGDLQDINSWKINCKNFSADVLIHAGWEGLPDYSYSMCKKNFDMSLNLFEVAYDLGISTIISTGSCWEYVSRTGILAEDSPLNYSTPFPAFKNGLRQLGEMLAIRDSIRFYWLRLFFVYGPGQREGSLLPYILRSLRDGQWPEVKTPLDCNDFVFVEDVANAVVSIAENRPPHSVYNVGNGISYSVSEVLRVAHELLGRKITNGDTVSIANEQSSDVQDFSADISLIRQDVGWFPEFSLQSGIAETLNFY